MEFHQLRYFVELARHRNFSRAAAACHVSQPSLSQQIKKLEAELGQSLIKRTRRGAVLSDYGETLLPRARQILAEADRIREDAQLQDAEIRGRVSLGAIPTIAPYLLPELVTACLESYPNMELNLVEDTTHVLVDKLRDGRLDFAILSPPIPHDKEMETVHLMEDELWITLGQTHPLASKSTITLPDLADFPIVLMKEAHCLSRQTLSLCHSSNIHPVVSIESSQLETVVALVENGLGFSFIPDLARTTMTHRNVLFRSVAPERVTRSITLAWPRRNSFSRTHHALIDKAAQWSAHKSD